jgi:hypothetical protein
MVHLENPEKKKNSNFLDEYLTELTLHRQISSSDIRKL